MFSFLLLNYLCDVFSITYLFTLGFIFKLQNVEKMESERQKMLKKIDSLQHQVNEKELAFQAAKQQIDEYKFKVAKAQQQLHDLERKYSKAKKIIKEFQKRYLCFCICSKLYHFTDLTQLKIIIFQFSSKKIIKIVIISK